MFWHRGGHTKRICSIDIPSNFDILYITGDSGSGKSTILNELCKEYKYEEIPMNLPLCKWCGDSPEEEQRAIKLLSLCGLSDATNFVSYYYQLSDSEKMRARMFLEIKSQKDIIVIDEFLSTLDRKTAKSLSYCFQKAIRHENKKLIVATAHNDLKDFLMPDVIVTGKSYPSTFKVDKIYNDFKNPFIDNIILKYGDKDTYRNSTLGNLHYKGKYTGGTKEFLFAHYENEIIGCLVSTFNMHTNGRRISRLVVHPSYRSIGVGQLIVRKYISDYPDTDVISAMGMYNKVFEKSGMIRVEDSVVNSPSGLRADLLSLDFDLSNWHDRKYCVEFAKDENIRNVLSKYASKCTKLVQPAGKHLDVSEIEEYIRNDYKTCGRIIYQLRDRTMAKYITNFNEQEKQNAGR